MRALWVHNFSPERIAAGVFMHILAEQMKQEGVAIDLLYTGSLRNPLRLRSAANRVREASAGYDLVHAQFGSACGLVASHAAGPKILSLRGTDLRGCHSGPITARAHGFLARRMTSRSLSAYDQVVVMSNRMRQELGTIYGYKKQAAVVPDGIDLSRFTPMSRSEARERLGLGDDNRPWVLFSSVTNGNDVKRAWLATAAVERAKQSRSDLVMQTLTGKPHTEVPLWINASDVVLLTSTHEGWPNIIKEAVACNVPFASTDVSDLGAIAHAESSCSVNDADPAALAQGLLTSLSQNRPTDLRRHVEGMELRATALQLARVYEQVGQAAPLAA